MTLNRNARVGCGALSCVSTRAGRDLGNCTFLKTAESLEAIAKRNGNGRRRFVVETQRRLVSISEDTQPPNFARG